MSILKITFFFLVGFFFKTKVHNYHSSRQQVPESRKSNCILFFSCKDCIFQFMESDYSIMPQELGNHIPFLGNWLLKRALLKSIFACFISTL